jgi:hypothetical protein
MSTPFSESKIDEAVDAPGIGIEVGNWFKCQAIVVAIPKVIAQLIKR